MTKMTRLIASLVAAMFVLTACNVNTPQLGPDGKPLPSVFRITNSQKNKIPFRVLDSVNALRIAAGLTPVELSAELTAAAATQSQDMSIQNRPWHFGSDGSSPIDRVARTGYAGKMLGENISETFENDVDTLAAWMTEADTRGVIMNPDARFMGISWFQEVSGKIWWTQVFGS
jgi:uncharacterized protein YkwD